MDAPSSSTATSRLLSMPAEIRLLIYEFTNPPVGNHVSDYKGFFMACKQIYDEAQVQLVEQVTKLLEGIEARWAKFFEAPIHITKPESFKEMRDVTVLMPISFFCHPHYIHSGIWCPLLFYGPLEGLLCLRISTLAIKLYEDETASSDMRASREYYFTFRDFSRQIASLLRERSSEQPFPKINSTGPTSLRSLQADTLVFEWGRHLDSWGKCALIGSISQGSVWWTVDAYKESTDDVREGIASLSSNHNPVRNTGSTVVGVICHKTKSGVV